MQHGRVLDVAQGDRIEPEHATDAACEVGDRERVAGRVHVLCLEGAHERVDRGQEARLELARDALAVERQRGLQGHPLEQRELGRSRTAAREPQQAERADERAVQLHRHLRRERRRIAGSHGQLARVRRGDDRLAACQPPLGLERAVALVALDAGVVRGRARHAAAHAVAVLVEPQRAAIAGHALGDRARQRLADRIGRGAVGELAREVEQHLGARPLLGRLLVQDRVLERQARDVRHDLEQAHVVAVEAALAVAGQHDRADGRVLAHERRGEQRRAALVEQAATGRRA